jgi:hypothetical protein
MHLSSQYAFSQEQSTRSVSVETKLTVIIPLISSIKVIDNPECIPVTNNDIATGYLDIPYAITLKYRCNMDGEVIIEGHLLEELVDNNEHNIPSDCLVFRIQGTSEYHPLKTESQKICSLDATKKEQMVILDLRLLLPRDTEPGLYYFKPSFDLVSL